MEESTVQYYWSFTFWLRKSIWFGLTAMSAWLIWQFIFRSFPDIKDNVVFTNGLLRIIGILIFGYVAWYFGRRFAYNWEKDAVIERLFTPQVEVEAAKDNSIWGESITESVDIATPPPFSSDDLKDIEGIDSAIEEILHKVNIRSFSDLARQKIEDLERILADAGENYRFQNPSDWPGQAQVIVDQQWEQLNK